MQNDPDHASRAHLFPFDRLSGDVIGCILVHQNSIRDVQVRIGTDVDSAGEA